MSRKKRANRASRKRNPPRAAKRGLSPGTLVIPGERPAVSLSIRVLDYRDGEVTELPPHSIDELSRFLGEDSTTWIQVSGLNDVEHLQAIGEALKIHPLALEDIASGGQRPKLELYGKDLFLVMNSLTLDREKIHVDCEQVSLLVRPGLVIQFREKQDEQFAPIETRLKREKSRFHDFGADYLLYAILDLIIDDHFHLLDELDEALDAIEIELEESMKPEVMTDIQAWRRQILLIRRELVPTREVTAALLREEMELFDPRVHAFLRDLHDHALRCTESLDSAREIVGSLADTYMSLVGNRMNEIMKVLTLFSTVFIPLTFLAGIYGMNFEHMPELHWKYSYPLLWGAFLLLPISLLTYFRRRGWLS